MATKGKGKKIFISYRREDASDIAGRIRDWLVQTRRITRDDIFMDVTAILPGADFMQVIDHTISQCRAVIIVISPSWLRDVNAPETSHVRMEAEAALGKGIPVIPVLVSDAKLPAAEQLPEKLRGLLRLNVQRLRHETFDYDMGLVVRALRLGPWIGLGWVAAVAAILLVALSLGVLTQVPPTNANPIWAALHAPTATASPTATATATATPSPGMLVFLETTVHTNVQCGDGVAASTSIQNTGGTPIQFQVIGKNWSSLTPPNGVLDPGQTLIINFFESGSPAPAAFVLVWSADLTADLSSGQVGTTASVPLVCP